MIRILALLPLWTKQDGMLQRNPCIFSAASPATASSSRNPCRDPHGTRCRPSSFFGGVSLLVALCSSAELAGKQRRPYSSSGRFSRTDVEISWCSALVFGALLKRSSSNPNAIDRGRCLPWLCVAWHRQVGHGSRSVLCRRHLNPFRHLTDISPQGFRRR